MFKIKYRFPMQPSISTRPDSYLVVSELYISPCHRSVLTTGRCPINSSTPDFTIDKTISRFIRQSRTTGAPDANQKSGSFNESEFSTSSRKSNSPWKFYMERLVIRVFFLYLSKTTIPLTLRKLLTLPSFNFFFFYYFFTVPERPQSLVINAPCAAVHWEPFNFR